MARPKHSQKVKVAYSLESPSLRPADGVSVQRRGVEGRGAGVGDCVGGGKTAEPVADPVGVTSPHDHLNTGLHNGGELGEKGAGV